MHLVPDGWHEAIDTSGIQVHRIPHEGPIPGNDRGACYACARAGRLEVVSPSVELGEVPQVADSIPDRAESHEQLGTAFVAHRGESLQAVFPFVENERPRRRHLDSPSPTMLAGQRKKSTRRMHSAFEGMEDFFLHPAKG